MILRLATDKYRQCIGGVMVISWRYRGDVLTTLWRWYSALWKAYTRLRDFTWNHIPCGCLMRSWIKNHFCSVGVLLGGDRAHKRKHRRCFADQFGDIGDGSPKSSAILSHRINIADIYTSMLRTSPMCRRCVWDILNLAVPRWLLSAARRCSAIYRRWFLATKHREKI